MAARTLDATTFAAAGLRCGKGASRCGVYAFAFPFLGISPCRWHGLPAQAAGCRGNQPFGAWIEEFTRDALSAGISRQTLASAQPYFIYDQSIVNRDRGQGVFAQSFLQFSDRMAAAYRIQKAGQLIQQHAAVFERIEKEFGVPPQPILAFWGLETDFGANIGDLPTIRSLVSLGFDCRRSEMFQKELLSALKIVQRGDLRARRDARPLGRRAWANAIPAVALFRLCRRL